jgi:hypothetical protein
MEEYVLVIFVLPADLYMEKQLKTKVIESGKE